MSKSNGFTVQLREILDDYSVEVKRATNNSMDVVAKESTRKLRSTSPRKTGDYAKGWSIKRERSGNGINSVIVYNKTHYQLTHLLENPREIVNRDHQGNRQAYGETSVGHGQIIHIKPVEEWANDELPNEIERELE